MDAYGDVDELNAWLGAGPRAPALDAGARRRCSSRSSAICSPSARGSPIPPAQHRRRASTKAVDRRRRRRAARAGWIDALEAELPPLRRFILAGGSPAGAALHVARTVCRRAERAIVALGADAVEPIVVIYVNRLSDLLFVMARLANQRAGTPEIEW